MNFQFALITTLLATAQSELYPVEESNEVYPNERSPDNFFASVFYENLANSTTGNFVTSPLSVNVALATLAIGASGETLDEMRFLLMDLPDYSEIDEYKSTTANMAKQDNFHLLNEFFIDDRLKIDPRYKAAVKLFRSGITSVNFSNAKKATSKINEYIRKHTNGQIRNLVTEKNVENAELLIANAAYFKGSWIHKFHPSRTYHNSFYVNSNTKKQIPMMHQHNTFKCGELEEVPAKYIKLPYKSDLKDEELSMYIIVPQKLDLTDVEQNLHKVNFYELNLRKKRCRVDLALPKFKIQSNFNLNQPLENMGLKRMFTNDSDLTGISSQEILKVSQIIQMNSLEIDENGSSAATATEIITTVTNRPEYQLRNVRFTVDRPFIVVITNSEFIVFVGRVIDPTL